MRYKASAKQLLEPITHCNDLGHRDTPGALCYVITLQKNPHPSLLARERGSNGGLIPLPDRDGWDGRGHSSTKQSEGKAKHRATSREIKRHRMGVSTQKQGQGKNRGDGYESIKSLALCQTDGMGSGSKAEERLPHMQSTNQLFFATIQL